MLDVPDDLATQSLLHAGQATSFHENHHIDGEAHDDDCVTEMFVGKMRGILRAVSEAKHKLSRRLKIARRPPQRRRKCWEVCVGAGLVS